MLHRVVFITTIHIRKFSKKVVQVYKNGFVKLKPAWLVALRLYHFEIKRYTEGIQRVYRVCYTPER